MTTDEAVEVLLDWADCRSQYRVYLNRSSVVLVLDNFGLETSFPSFAKAAAWAAKQPEYLEKHGR